MKYKQNIFNHAIFINKKVYYASLGSYKRNFYYLTFNKRLKKNKYGLIILNKTKKSNKYLISRTMKKRKRNLFNKNILAY